MEIIQYMKALGLCLLIITGVSMAQELVGKGWIYHLVFTPTILLLLAVSWKAVDKPITPKE